MTTASDAHKCGRLDLKDLQSERSYAAMGVYGTSKLCNILFTRELARARPELHANCFHPGVVRTGFGKNENGVWKILTTLGGPSSARRSAARARWSGWRCPTRQPHSPASTSKTRSSGAQRPGPGRAARRGALGAKRPARRPAGLCIALSWLYPYREPHHTARAARVSPVRADLPGHRGHLDAGAGGPDRYDRPLLRL